MLYFVKYNFQGDILSFCSIEKLPEGKDNPYGLLNEGEFVQTVKLTAAQKKLEPTRIHEEYIFDFVEGKLKKKK